MVVRIGEDLEPDLAKKKKEESDATDALLDGDIFDLATKSEDDVNADDLLDGGPDEEATKEKLPEEEPEIISPISGKKLKIAKSDRKKKPKGKRSGSSRDEKKQAFLDRGPYTFVEKRRVHDFICICGAHGRTANVLRDKDGQEVLAGESCARYLGVRVPKAVSNSPNAVGL